mmetsp:Transcript_79042/g.164173  ORF Transcript_79042/g.164173 Transcript_79042/m.164173 type:complete len:273 (-) Transcript_79042:321-1139(-)
MSQQLKLHFNVFGQADSVGRRTLLLDNAEGTSVRELKKRMFAEAVEANKNIRFIAQGRVLADDLFLGLCNLGDEAHIHVSISSREPPAHRATVDDATVQSSGDEVTHAASAPAICEPVPLSRRVSAHFESAKGALQAGGLSLPQLLGAVVFAGVGVGLQQAWRKRMTIQHSTSQLLFILAACWAYALLVYVLPVLAKGFYWSLSSTFSYLMTPATSSDGVANGPRGGNRHPAPHTTASTSFASTICGTPMPVQSSEGLPACPSAVQVPSAPL